MYRNFFKRFIDIIASGLGLIFLSPVLLITGYLIRKNLGSPVIFKQERPGKDGKIFTMYKFRSMRDGDASDADRLTPFGKKLRATSLDELPELWNVLKGDMSLVGPRPLLVEYLDRYTPEQARRHEVRPGVTGWAQINGRNAISWEEKFKLDIEYINSYNFVMDIKILFLTITKVFVKEGIVQEGNVTAEKFMGK
ncbi:sugar transferase [Cetobacterium sp. 2A]|uniref:sugar transferase n=1 Tax=Cetobacterium sp. 2A TaxID=2754723 RepID=UPI00163BBAC1|nr:sugar transferase [Cetobacterium sp. 2A]MBC2856182.1 sugar transferase [Cetobacterium sp. 2A]